MAKHQSKDDVQRLFREGVEAVQDVSGRLSVESWELPACGRWSGAETARHLVSVARWYHEWLDRAIGGDASPPFPADELDVRNEQALAQVGDLSGPESIREYVATALAYLDRTADHWHLPYGYPFGTVTVGLHCGVASAEWHLHAWDLSGLTTTLHRPADPEGLFVAAGNCVAAARGGIRRRMLESLVPLAARRKPWSTIVERSGRTYPAGG